MNSIKIKIFLGLLIVFQACSDLTGSSGSGGTAGDTTGGSTGGSTGSWTDGSTGDILVPTTYFNLPVAGTFSGQLLTDSFGPRILNGIYDFHRGLDIDQERGDPIYSAGAGTIVHAGTEIIGHPRSGIFVVIEHAKHMFTGYLHLDSLAEGISKGVSVKAGSVIGYAGDSGENINSVHLHFNFYVSNNSGEIPSESREAYPPLLILDYPDTANHTVAITTINSTDISHASINVHTTVPVGELDLNKVTLTITDISGSSVYSKEVNFSERTNCGTDTAEVNDILIVPEDYKPSSNDGFYDTDFTFKNIDLSAYSGQTLTLKASAIDLRDNEKTTQTTLVIP